MGAASASKVPLTTPPRTPEEVRSKRRKAEVMVEYVSLSELRKGKSANVFAVVTTSRFLAKASSCRDDQLRMEVRDKTCAKFEVVIFSANANQLPRPEVGDIIRLQRIRPVSNYSFIRHRNFGAFSDRAYRRLVQALS
jgi:hypothetical protein